MLSEDNILTIGDGDFGHHWTMKLDLNVIAKDCGVLKKETWKDFQAGTADCIICQYQSGGVGLNLQRASTEILYEPCYSSLLLTQAKGRIYRADQKSRCVYYFLYTPNTIEKRVWDTVKAGKDFTDKLMEEWAFKGVIRCRGNRRKGRTSSSGRTSSIASPRTYGTMNA